MSRRRTAAAPTITYALLGLLALRPWTGYQLTRQVRSTLRLVWPSSEAHVYREQRRLVSLGWATAHPERESGRTRNRYEITEAGRAELRRWLDTPPAPATLEVEALVRLWFADLGTPAQAASALTHTATEARASMANAAQLAGVYLAGQGAFPARAHLNALVGELIAELLTVIADRCDAIATEVGGWDSTTGHGLDAATRRRLHRIVAAGGA